MFDSQVGTYLTNELSNSLISTIDNSPQISVGELFERLKDETKKSHVCFYGDESIKSEKLASFKLYIDNTWKETLLMNKLF